MTDLLKSISGKLDGYRGWAAHEHYMWSCRRMTRLNNARYQRWIESLRRDPPQVYVGPDSGFGGVQNHVRAIRSHSALRVQLVPEEGVTGTLDTFTEEVKRRFMDFEPVGTPVVHSHVMPWMIRWCRRQQDRGLRWVHTYHLNYFEEHSKNGLLPWQREINEALVNEAQYADVRISVSKWQQIYLEKEFGISTVYLPNGVDVELCDQADAKRFLQKTGITQPFVLWVGRNVPVKNPADFVQLSQRSPHHKFVMVGHGLSTTALVDQWQLESPPNLMVCGEATHAEVQDAIASCSCLVVTSKREGLPTLVLEAMAQGKPVVVPDEAGCVEAIDGGEFGLIYRPGDMDDLVEKTFTAISNPQCRPKARERVIAEYDWRTVAAKLDAIYKHCVDRLRRSRSLI